MSWVELQADVLTTDTHAMAALHPERPDPIQLLAMMLGSELAEVAERCRRRVVPYDLHETLGHEAMYAADGYLRLAHRVANRLSA